MDKIEVRTGYNPQKVKLYTDPQKNKTLMDWYYTKPEIDEMLKYFVLSGSTYTKDEVYSKSETLNKNEILDLYNKCVRKGEIDNIYMLLNQKENLGNKTKIITENSTDIEYPSAKAVYNAIKSFDVLHAGRNIEIDSNKNINALGYDYDASGKTFTTEGDVIFTSGGTINRLSEKEDRFNKVTVIDSGSTDTEYPSAKAVYDITKNTKELYWCEYQTTPYTEISSAYNSGQFVLCKYSGGLYYASSKDDSGLITFKCLNETIGEKYESGNRHTTYLSEDVLTIGVDNIWNNSASISNIVSVTDNLNSTSLTHALSANQGKVLNETKENISNKITTLYSGCTDTQYASAKCVFDVIAKDELAISKSINQLNTRLTLKDF